MTVNRKNEIQNILFLYFKISHCNIQICSFRKQSHLCSYPLRAKVCVGYLKVSKRVMLFANRKMKWLAEGNGVIQGNKTTRSKLMPYSNYWPTILFKLQ